MPTPFWIPTVSPVQTGEPVDASTTNRPILQLTDREQYLYDQIQSLNQKSGRLVSGSVELGSGAVVGNVVFLNSDTGRYEPALANFSYLSGKGVVAESSHACGLVLSTDGFGLGDVLLRGVINTTDYGLSIPNLLDQAGLDISSSAFYLSRQVAGKISSRPSAPIVALGFFSDDNIVFDPTAIGSFNLHRHDAFNLNARPAASQNTAGTGFNSATHFVDYFHGDNGESIPVIAMGFRAVEGQVPTTNNRIDFIKDGSGNLAISVVSGGGLVITDPTSGSGSSISLGSQAWPQYGQYLSVPSMGIEVFFFRTDGNYADHTLAGDVISLISASTDSYKIFLPNDASGWTNVNPFDPATPSRARLRYVLETDVSINSEFPPQPIEASDLTLNGLSMDPLLDYTITLEGLWWTGQTALNSSTGNHVGDPWPVDYSAIANTSTPANAVRLRLFFARSEYQADGSIVTSLQSDSQAITITRCPSGETSATGNLQIGLSLELAASTTLVQNAETAFTTVEGVELNSTSIVSELVAGNGIALQRLSPNSGSAFTGKILVSQTDTTLEGEISSIAVRGASEIAYHNNLFPYLNFKRLDGRPGPTGAIASFKLPSSLPTPTKLEVRTSCFGDIAVANNIAGLTALFKVVYQVVRPGISLPSLSDSTAAAIQYWSIPFQPGYSAFSTLAQEYPAPVGVNNPFALTLTSITTNSPSALILPTGFQNNDSVFVYIQRLAISMDQTLIDNYTGQVGFVGLRWTVSPT